MLIRITRCGVCHSDVHLQDGYFSLGGDKKLDVSAGRTLPFTLGHEIAGTVEKAGPDATVKAGQSFAVFPWIGCGQCGACKAGEENLCLAPRNLGIQVDGGFATHVLVPHEKYLLDHNGLPAALAGAYMCSGLTAFSALKRITEHAKRGPVLLVGLGGVGMMGFAFARALFPYAPIVADIDAAKCDAAMNAGAAAAYDPRDPGARKALLKATGGVFAAVDFVGSDGSLAFASGALAKGGKVVITGLIGGTYTTPIAMFPLRAITVEGTMTGTLAEAEEMITLARAGKVPPVPIIERPLSAAQASIDELRNGRGAVGRVVLTP